MTSDLVGSVRQALAAVADPDKAPAMQSYMKSQMPFLGVQQKQRAAALRPVFAAAQLDRGEWLAAAVELWDGASFREERYAALALLRQHRAWLEPCDEPLLRHLVTSGAWWDLVDETATKLVGPLRFELPMRQWAVDDDMWIRRSAIICQVGAKAKTDPALLADVIEPNLSDRTFWIAKAVGWGLRDYARTDPQWVRGFVSEHTLVPLSAREATKHL